MSAAERTCPALLVAAPASGQGKTTVTAGLARYHRDRGRRVRVFKTGPDFLDPMILEQASGHPVHQLDLWMVGQADCRALLYEAAAEADLILVEGVMGLFDGNPSTADLAEHLDLPVLAVINAGSMAQSFGAIALGLREYRPHLTLAGVLANQVANERHTQMLREGLPLDLKLFGAIYRDGAVELPGRHLGLLQAAEVTDLEARLTRAAAAIAETALAELPPSAAFAPAEMVQPPALLAGRRIGVARDQAFSFLYPANLDSLRAMGGELVFFSPLADEALPALDALYLPGGYPELHLRRLADNQGMRDALQRHHRAGRPIYAECGGLLYLLETLTDKAGVTAPMVGLIPGHGHLQPRLTALGFQSAAFSGGTLRGHTFHHSTLETPLTPAFRATRQRGEDPGEAIYRYNGLRASYLHLYFPSSPQAAASLFLP